MSLFRTPTCLPPRVWVVTVWTLAIAAVAVSSTAFAQRYESGSTGRYAGTYKSGDRNGTSAPGRTYNPQYTASGTYRQPVSLLMLDDAQTLVATKLTGEIYRFNPADRTVKRAEVAPVAGASRPRQFHRMVKLADDRFAVTDTLNQEVVIYRDDRDHNRCVELTSARVPGGPNGITFDSANSELWVTSAWAQRLYRYDVVDADTAGDVQLKHLGSIDLPMCGGQVLCLPGSGFVLVTDAFGCEFVVLDHATGSVVNHDAFYEHNVCELTAIDGGKSVLFPQQLLNSLTEAREGDITWGNFLSNNMRVLPIERLAKHQGDAIYTGSKYLPIGEFGNGAGDPTSMAMHGSNDLAVTIGGTNQVGLGTLDGYRFRFIDVGLHPVDCAFTSDGKTLIVVNQFSDSISLVDVVERTAEHIALGALRPPTEVERGEMLFHDSTLSHDSWMSCQSCHTGGHTNGLLTDNFTDHSYRSPKRVLSLLGQADTAPYSWAGKMATLEEQIAFSIKSTMASDEAVRREDVDQLAAYVRSLPSPPSVIAARDDERSSAGVQEAIERGRQIFNTAGCVDCHSGPHYTSPNVYDVGLHDERELREYNPPSLIGVSQRQRALFHDARGKSLEDVVTTQSHQLPSTTTTQQRQQLIQFLRSL